MVTQMVSEKKGIGRAKQVASRFINYRERSTREVTDRLAKDGFEKSVIENTIDYLRRHKLLDDRRFAMSFAEARMRLRPSGRGLIRKKLTEKGVSVELADSVLDSLCKEQDYDEYDTARKAALSRMKKGGGSGTKRRLYQYLLRRRFDKDIIERVIEDLFQND